ncbi:MAG: NifU family protein [Bacteroidota bacterium]|jgi:Fe-S cluster biogenesis protein NfuA
MNTTSIPVTVYSEMTPNPESMKFVCDRMMLDGNSAEFSSLQDATDCPLALALFDFPFVKGVFIMNNVITLTKDSATEWNDVIPTLRQFIKLYLDDLKPVFNIGFQVKQDGNAPQLDDNEVIGKIKEALDTYVKPAVEMDGGAIQFKSYHEGIVTLMLKGSCSGCPSSAITLKSGVEGLLKRIIPEVKQVVAENA